MGGINSNCTSSPKDQRVQAPQQAPQPCCSIPGRQTPECLALKASRAYFQESQRTVGNRNSTLKGHTQNLTHSETQKRSCKLKESWIRHTFWSWRASQRNRGNWSSPWGHRHGQQSLGLLSTKRTLELPSSIFGIPSLT